MRLGGAELDGLAARLGGRLLVSGGDGYEAARRIWNGMIAKRPALIARCRETEEVAAVVGFASERRLSLAVKAGGHNVAGNSLSDGGLVIDLAEMRGVRVDAERRTVTIDAGATLGDVDRATYPHGLATPMGVVTATGYAGLTLHGGTGWQLRKHGLAADNVARYEIVTAGGEVRTVSPDREPDLFWALRGGGGNFGVVTSFTSRLHPVPGEVLFAVPVYALQEAPAVLRFLSDYMPQAPEELMVIGALWTAPEEPRVPREHRGEPVLILLACFVGDPSEAGGAIEPLRSFRPTVADLTQRMSWLDVQRFFDADYPDGRRYYWKSTMVGELSDPVIQAMVEQTRRRPSMLTSIDIWALGGAFARVDGEAAAFGDRRAAFMVNYESNWEDPDEDASNVGWTRACLAEIRGLVGGRTYLNFAGLGEEGDRLVRESFGTNYARLQAVKAAHDPGNLFRSNFNIPPGPAGAAGAAGGADATGGR